MRAERTLSDISVTRRSGALAEVVTVAGEIDIATYTQLRAVLLKAVDEGPGSVVVDMEAKDNANDSNQRGVAELCGRCGRGVAAISPDGDVWPCVFSRWIPVGNVLTSPLAEILAGQAMADAVASIPNGRQAECEPDLCEPDIMCTPGSPPSSCAPRT
jgi:MoaA/NifB/PqqE/SkfB family radical SAM enzyme